MRFRNLVTILILTTFFLFGLNLSSNDDFISNENNILTARTNLDESYVDIINLQSNQDNILTQTNDQTSDVLIEIFSETNNLTFELPYRGIYSSQTMFREYILPTLNSVKICELYTLAHSKNPSISPQNFLPPERFFKYHTVLLFTTKLEQKILYNFKVSEEPTQFSHFTPILYNPTDKKIEAISLNQFVDFENISEGCVIANFGQQFSLFRPELNSKPFDDEENKTVMIATETNSKTFILILEDNILKQHSLICNGNYKRQNSNGSILLYKTPKLIKGNEIENIEYPRDLKFILKAKYMSGVQKYFFKFQYGHIKFSQTILPVWFSLINILNRFRTRIMRKVHPNRYTALTKLENIFELFTIFIFLIFQAYIWMAPYKALMAAVFSPLYLNYSLKTFLFALNLEPLSAALFWGPTLVYQDLQLSETHFKIYPLNQMFVIPTLKMPMQHILREFMFAWLVMIVLTSFVYFFIPSQISGEFLE